MASFMLANAPRLLSAPSARLRRPSQGILAVARCRVFASAAAPPPAGPVKHYLLYYSYVSDILERRGPYRAEHIAGATKQVESKKMLMAGAHDNPVDGAVFVWGPTADKALIEAFVAGDPYVVNGLVKSWTIREWNVVVGAAAQ